MSEALRLRAENLGCERGGRLVFDHVNFELRAGELMELRGPNGAGKSSLLRLLAGLNIPAAGSVVLENAGADATLPEQSHYIGHAEANKPALTVLQNLKFWADVLGGTEITNALSTFSLQALADDQALLLSAGQKRRLALARLIAAKRPVWLLDEPTVGLDATSIGQLQAVAAAHLDAGGMIIAATHTELGMKSARHLQLGPVR